MRVLSVGEILWDVFPAEELLGGAPLNVCANLTRLGDEAILLSAVGRDSRGRAALKAMHSLGLNSAFVLTTVDRPTGTATVHEDADGHPLFTIDRPAAYDSLTLSAETLESIEAFDPDWLYVGTLIQTEPAIEALVRDLTERLPHARCFYDMNLRSGHWNLGLVEQSCHQASVLKLNEVEAETLSTLNGVFPEEFSLETFCSAWAKRFDIDAICVTLGPEGCLIYSHGKAERFDGLRVQVVDTVGAGDAFASAFLHGYHQGWPIARCAGFANALGSLVAGCAGATPAWTMEQCQALLSSQTANSSAQR